MVPARQAAFGNPDYQQSDNIYSNSIITGPTTQEAKDFHRLRKPGLSVSFYQGVADAEEPSEWWSLAFDLSQFVYRGPQQPTNW